MHINFTIVPFIPLSKQDFEVFMLSDNFKVYAEWQKWKLSVCESALILINSLSLQHFKVDPVLEIDETVNKQAKSSSHEPPDPTKQ